jgi:hypothetical protein
MPLGILDGYGDPECIEHVLAALPNVPRPIFYATCHHPGNVVRLSNVYDVSGSGWLLDERFFKTNEIEDVVIVSGDAIITPREHFLPQTLVAGGADCFHAAFVSNTYEGVMHLSVTNEHGWNNPNFLGPVTDNVFSIVDPYSTSMVIGPTIRSCDYEWEEDVVEQLLDGIRKLDPHIKLDDVVRPRPNTPGKVGFDFLKVVVRHLIQLGISPERINLDHAECTYCHPATRHSRRRDGKDDPRRLRNLVALLQIP